MELYEALVNRRSNYALSNKSPISDRIIEQVLRGAVQYSPSAFHSQSSRVALLLGEQHQALWSIVKETLRPLLPADGFAATEARLAGFAAGYGTVLFFEDAAVVAGLQEKIPAYADNFPVWSEQSAGMLQYVVWVSLSAEGLGASIQHYNPLIDQEVKQRFDIPDSWRLVAQMPFGTPTGTPAELEYKDFSGRVVVRA